MINNRLTQALDNNHKLNTFWDFLKFVDGWKSDLIFTDVERNK